MRRRKTWRCIVGSTCLFLVSFPGLGRRRRPRASQAKPGGPASSRSPRRGPRAARPGRPGERHHRRRRQRLHPLGQTATWRRCGSWASTRPRPGTTSTAFPLPSRSGPKPGRLPRGLRRRDRHQDDPRQHARPLRPDPGLPVPQRQELLGPGDPGAAARTRRSASTATTASRAGGRGQGRGQVRSALCRSSLRTSIASGCAPSPTGRKPRSANLDLELVPPRTDGPS